MRNHCAQAIVYHSKCISLQGVMMEMAGSSIRNYIPRIITLLASYLIIGHNYKPNEILCGHALSHKIVEQVAGKKMKPVGPRQISNCGFTLTFVWCSASTRTNLQKIFGSYFHNQVKLEEEEIEYLPGLKMRMSSAIV